MDLAASHLDLPEDQLRGRRLRISSLASWISATAFHKHPYPEENGHDDRQCCDTTASISVTSGINQCRRQATLDHGHEQNPDYDAGDNAIHGGLRLG